MLDLSLFIPLGPSVLKAEVNFGEIISFVRLEF